LAGAGGEKKNTGILVGLIITAAAVAAVVALVRFDVRGEKQSGLSSEFVYDTNGLGEFDPALILYKESTEPISTGFNQSHGIAVGPGGDIFVAGDKAVRVFDRRGVKKNEIALSDEPLCVTAAGDGRVYVGMRDHIEVFDSGLKRAALWAGLGDRAVLTSIAVCKNDVFAADAGNRIVLHYDTSGKLINKIGRKDPERNIPGFVIPSAYFDVAVGPDGLLRVADTGRRAIEAYTFDGDLEFSWGEFSMGIEGFCGCCNPANFTMLPDGSFVTSEKGLIRVKIYDPDGKFVAVVAGPQQLMETGIDKLGMFSSESAMRGFDVAVDANGRVLVLDTIKNTIRIFTRKKVDL